VRTQPEATTLDERQDFEALFQEEGQRCRASLEARGAKIVHGVDARAITAALPGEQFDCVEWNFPRIKHAGCESDPSWGEQHFQLLCGFFKQCTLIICADHGTVRVTLVDERQFVKCRVEEAASDAGLRLSERVKFLEFDPRKIRDYVQRREVGGITRSFPIDHRAHTYVFGYK
jgi:hypothetical protein